MKKLILIFIIISLYLIPFTLAACNQALICRRDFCADSSDEFSSGFARGDRLQYYDGDCKSPCNDYVHDYCTSGAKILLEAYCNGKDPAYTQIDCFQKEPKHYCNSGACQPCQCRIEEGECCKYPCIFVDAGTDCGFINNIASGKCTGNNAICHIYDENTNNICSDTLIYGWEGQIPKELDYPQTQNNRIGSCCGDDGVRESGIIAVNGKFLCAKKTPTTWAWLNVQQFPGTIYKVENPEGNEFDAISDKVGLG